MDLIPYSKESSKTLIVRQSRIVSLLHCQEFSAYNDYANYLLQRYPNDRDLRTLLSLYDVEKKIILKERRSAWQDLPAIEQSLRHPELSQRQTLTAFFLTTKGKLLSLDSEKESALGQYEQALHESLLGPSRCLETPYLLHMSSYVRCHVPDDVTGSIRIPSESTLRNMECSWHRAYMQDMDMKDILEEDGSSRDISKLNFFPSWKGVHYLCVILRSCASGGFLFFDDMPCPLGNLKKAYRLIKLLEQDRGSMSLRTRIGLCMYKCDYNLRIAGRNTHGSDLWFNAMSRANRHIKKAKALCKNYRSPNYEMRCELRLHYINQKLSGQDKVNWLDTENLSPLTRSCVSNVLEKTAGLGVSVTGYEKPYGNADVGKKSQDRDLTGAIISNEALYKTNLGQYICATASTGEADTQFSESTYPGYCRAEDVHVVSSEAIGTVGLELPTPGYIPGTLDRPGIVTRDPDITQLKARMDHTDGIVLCEQAGNQQSGTDFVSCGTESWQHVHVDSWSGKIPAKWNTDQTKVKERDIRD